MDFAPLTLGELAALSGVEVKEIRTYQEVGLLPSPRERPGEAYYRGDLEVLWIIRRASVLGFSVSAITDLLSVKREDGTCGDVYAIAQRSFDAIRSTGLEPSPDLARLMEACPRAGGAKNCPVLAELAQPLTASPAPSGYVQSDRDRRADCLGNGSSMGDTSSGGLECKWSPDARSAQYRGHAKAARSTAYTFATECVRSDWLKVAASWDRLADLEEMSLRQAGGDAGYATSASSNEQPAPIAATSPAPAGPLPQPSVASLKASSCPLSHDADSRQNSTRVR